MLRGRFGIAFGFQRRPGVIQNIVARVIIPRNFTRYRRGRQCLSDKERKGNRVRVNQSSGENIIATFNMGTVVRINAP